MYNVYNVVEGRWRLADVYREVVNEVAFYNLIKKRIKIESVICTAEENILSNLVNNIPPPSSYPISF